MSDQILSQPRLQELLSYDPETGLFIWRVTSSNRAVAGSVAGTQNSSGYLVVGLDGILYRAHRLAWFYIHGEFPPAGLDHKNRDRADNRISNLRPATPAENNQNLPKRQDNTSEYAGVSWVKRRQKWLAQLTASGTRYSSYHTTKKEAIESRKEMELKHFKFQNPI